MLNQGAYKADIHHIQAFLEEKARRKQKLGDSFQTQVAYF